MADPIGTAMQYLQDTKTEHKVAGIMILNSVLNTNSVPNVEQVVAAAVKLGTASFVVKMVETEDTQGRSVQVQLAGLNFIALACNTKATAKPFLANVQSLIAVYFKTVHVEVREQLAACLRLLCMVLGKEGRTKMIDLLLSPTQSKASPSTQALQIVTDILNSGTEDAKSTTMATLSAAHATVLRSLIVQGVHGAAPQNTRDTSLLCCNQLLTAHPHLDHTYALSPTWTIVTSATTTASATTDTAQQAQQDTFPRFLCSIVRGELQMLCDELLFLASNNAASVAERFAACVPTRADLSRTAGAPASASNTAGASAATDSAAGSTSAPSAAPEPHGSDNSGHHSEPQAEFTTTTTSAESDIAYFRSRIHRTLAMYATCLHLLENILQLLIGTSSVERSEQPPAWCSLPSEKLLEVKKCLYGTLNDLFLFVQDCAAQLQEAEKPVKSGEQPGELAGESTVGAFMPLSMLRTAVCATVDTLATYAVQDAELLTVFTKALPSMLLCSSWESKKAYNTADILSSLTYYANGAVLKDTLISAMQYDTAENKPDALSKAEPLLPVVQGEVVLHLVEALKVTVGPTVKQVGSKQSASDSVKDQEEEVVVGEEVLEQLFDSYPQLVARICDILHIACAHLHSVCMNSTGADTSGGQDEVRTVLSASVNLALLLRDLVICRELKHANEVHILLRSEEDAVYSVFGIRALELKQLTADMTAKGAQLQQRYGSVDTNMAEEGAELAAISEQIISNVFRVVEY